MNHLSLLSWLSVGHVLCWSWHFCIRFCENRCWDAKLWPVGGTIVKIQGSSKSTGLLHCKPQMHKQNFMPVQEYFSLDQNSWQADFTTAVCRASLSPLQLQLWQICWPLIHLWLFLTDNIVKLVTLETAGRWADTHPGVGWAAKLQVHVVRHATNVVVSECGWVGEQAGVKSGPFEALLEVPGLNADSLRVIKNSLS